MKVLNLIRRFWGCVFPYISRIHTAYIGEDSSILGTKKMFGDIPGPLMGPWDSNHLGCETSPRIRDATRMTVAFVYPLVN